MTQEMRSALHISRPQTYVYLNKVSAVLQWLLHHRVPA